MNPNNNLGSPIAIRLDGLTRTQLNWIKAQFPEANISNAGIFRCALANYVRTLERDLDAQQGLSHHLLIIRAARQGSPSPIKSPRQFTPGIKLSDLIREEGQLGIDRLFYDQGFEKKAQAMWGDHV